jgi:urease accessory protein
MRRLTIPGATAILLMTGSTVFAHPQSFAHSHASGFDAGLYHPLLGIDHLLAMVAVGLLAARAGGRAIWLVPGAFLACMVVGGIVGMSGAEFWGVETAIAVSVVLLGAALAASRNLPLGLMLAACGLFGFFHGHAHGAEMPAIAQPALYAAGFVLATAALHALGVAIGRFSIKTAARQSKLRFSGAAIAVAGLAFLVWS